eukprot:scaffold2908_cov257-Pinguiococcus_pyrenoidosus.AAC.1
MSRCRDVEMSRCRHSKRGKKKHNPATHLLLRQLLSDPEVGKDVALAQEELEPRLRLLRLCQPDILELPLLLLLLLPPLLAPLYHSVAGLALQGPPAPNLVLLGRGFRGLGRGRAHAPLQHPDLKAGALQGLRLGVLFVFLPVDFVHLYSLLAREGFVSFPIAWRERLPLFRHRGGQLSDSHLSISSLQLLRAQLPEDLKRGARARRLGGVVHLELPPKHETPKKGRNLDSKWVRAKCCCATERDGGGVIRTARATSFDD